MPETIESAICTTVASRVLCRRKWSNAPAIFTIPVIEISPTGGKVLCTPNPGSKAPSETVRKPHMAFHS